MLVNRCIQSKTADYLTEFLNKLQLHSCPALSSTTETDIQLKIDTDQYISVNSDLLGNHSEYFKTLFGGPYAERNQSIVTLHLPETVSNDSFVHLVDLLTNNNEKPQPNLILDLFRLCDHYLFDYLPYRLVHYILNQCINESTTNSTFTISSYYLTPIVSKPNLISSLIRACFHHLLTTDTNISVELFSKLAANHKDDLRILIVSFIRKTCWFDNDLSPFPSDHIV